MSYGKAVFFAVAVSMLAAVFIPDAQARNWKTSPQDMARDYLIIQDQRSVSEMVLIVWLAPPIVPNAPENKPARDVLGRFATIGVVHAKINDLGEFSFLPGDNVKIRLLGNAEQSAMLQEQIPPAALGALETIRAIFQRALGQVGHGTSWHVFDTAGVDACGAGRLAVLFAGEEYTYDLPIPGCAGAK